MALDTDGRVVLFRIGSDPLDNPDAVVRRVLPIEPSPVVGPTVETFTPVATREVYRSIQLTFGTLLTPAGVSTKSTYRLISAGRDGVFGTRADRSIRVAGVTYSPAPKRVVLRPAIALALRGRYRFTAIASRLIDSQGHPLVGGDYVATFGR